MEWILGTMDYLRQGLSRLYHLGVINVVKGAIQSAAFLIHGREIGKCEYKNGYPFNGLVLEADFIWTYFTLKTI